MQRYLHSFTLVGALCECACVLSIDASAQTQAASTTAANSLPPVDKNFVQVASMSSSTEIDAARLDVTRAFG